MEVANFTEETLRVEDPEAAKLLSNPKTLELLWTFMVERTASQAARFRGMEVSAMAYWIRRFLALGLIEVSRTEPRAGRALKYYRCVAQGYLMPFAAVPVGSLETGGASPRSASAIALRHRNVSSTLETLHVQLQERIQMVLTQSQVALLLEHEANAAVYLYRHPARPLAIQYLDLRTGEPIFTLGPDSPAYLNRWENLTLSFEEAKSLQLEMAELVERYLGRSGGQRYIVRLAMAPLAD